VSSGGTPRASRRNKPLASATVVVSCLSVTPVKGTRLHSVGEVRLERDGARDDRRFFVIDERDRMLNAKQVGELPQVLAELSYPRLTLTFPGGQIVSDDVELGPKVTAKFYSRSVEGRVVEGPFGEALSGHVGKRLRLVEPPRAGVDRGRRGGTTAVSRASLERLADEAGADGIDARRFRMLVEIDGVRAHEEDSWVGRVVRIGDAAVRFNGHVGRCLVTSRDPESGELDLPTLDLLRSYRGELARTELLPFGVYGEVLEPGMVRVGDPVLVD
jgi:MOSC domain-containing protein